MTEDVHRSSTDDWPSDHYVTLSNDSECALDLLELVDNTRSWIHRRVERISFHDDISISHHLSLDFTVPPRAPLIPTATGDGMNSRLIPLSMLHKRPLSSFDTRDEATSPVPVLTTEQNATVALSMLKVWAESILQSEVPNDIANHFDRIIRCSADEGPACLADFEHGPLESEGARRILLDAADGAFAALLTDLSHFFLLLLYLPTHAHQRRVIKVSYDLRYRVGWRGRPFRHTAERIGFLPSTAQFELTAPIPAESQHFEVVKPDDVDVVGFNSIREPSKREQYTSGGGQSVHAHYGALEEGEAVVVRVDLQPESRGWLRTSWMGSILITILLLFLAFAVDDLTPTPDEQGTPGASLLLAVAAVAVSALSRPREHALATNLLWVMRRISVIPPLCAFALAVGLVVRSPTIPSETLAIFLAIASLVGGILITITVAGTWIRRKRVQGG